MSELRLTAAEWRAMLDAPVRDRGYRQATGLGSLIGEWLAYKRLQGRSERTIDQYERDVAHFAKRYPAATAATATSAEIMEFLASLTPAQRKRARAALSEFFRWATIWDHCARNPMERIPSIDAPPQQVVETFTPEEVDLLVSTGELRDRALMALLFGSGIRDGEARQLRVCDLREDSSLFVEGKGRKQRLVPLPKRVVGLLHELVVLDGLNPDDHWWYTQRYSPTGMRVRRAKPLGYASFWRWWERCLNEAGVRYRKPHATRHTYATEYLRRGGRIERLSRILGHSSVAITDQAYAHLNLRDLAEDVLRVWDEPS